MATWVGYPRSYTPGRTRPVQYVVIHTTQGSEGPLSAEAGAAYDKRRTDGVSTHIFVDSDSAVREVPDGDRAHHARFHGNEIGLGVELCGLAGQTAEQWHDGASTSQLALAAREVAAMCRAHDLPPRRLTVAEVRAAYYAPADARPRGICGHVDVSKAYPEDQGTHWDPGPNFPWSEFLAMVAAELEDDMAEVFYRIQSQDPEWNGRVYVSNRIHSRRLRNPGIIQARATSGAQEVILRDVDRLGVGAGETWERFIVSVAGPEFEPWSAPAVTEHTHTVGPATPTT